MTLVYLSVFSALLGLVRCLCILEINDFTVPQPFFEFNGDFLKPISPNGTITLKEGDQMVVSCASSQILLGGHNETVGMNLRATCIRDKKFLIDDWAVDVKHITCKKSPDLYVEKLGTECYDQTILYGVGYKILRTFYKLYDICYNEDRGHTLYSHHTMYPTSAQKMSYAPNFMFIEGGLFNSVKVKNAYKRANQIERFKKILGDGAVIEPYFKNNQYLARGHLAPRADFPLYNMQKLTYLYANVAPQWAKFNEGDWKNLEDGLRKRVKTLGYELQIYTGTHGILTLLNEDGVEKPIYLTVDDNNNDVVPVPLYFYKVVYDAKTQAATAFVSINFAHYDSKRIAKLTFCKDICTTVTQLDWVKWSLKDGITSFCCRYSEFVKVIPYVGDLTVNSVFY